MAASTAIRSEGALRTYAVAAASAARTAPRGPGLAPVVPLPFRVAPEGGQADAPGEGMVDAASHGPALRVVAEPVRRTRQAGVRVSVRVAGLLVAIGLVLGGVGSVLASGTEAPVAAGHVVLQPGETLWDIALRSAPAGVDPRQQLDVLRRLNGFGPGALDAWTVVLIPAG
jgi:hypothetical protein